MQKTNNIEEITPSEKHPSIIESISRACFTLLYKILPTVDTQTTEYDLTFNQEIEKQMGL